MQFSLSCTSDVPSSISSLHRLINTWPWLSRDDESPEEMEKILECYSAIRAELKERGHNDAKLAHKTSGLFEMSDRGSTGLFALFGGQGVGWLEELRTSYRVYVEVRPTIEKAIAALHKQATYLIEKEEDEADGGSGGSRGAQDESESGVKGFNELFTHGLDVMEWITDKSSVPPSTYLSSAPISYPMIGLTSLINYLVCIKTWDISPAEAVAHFKGATGKTPGTLSPKQEKEKQKVENSPI